MRFLRIAWIIVLSSVVASANLLSSRFDPFLGANWYGIYMQEQKIGYATITLEKQGETTWILNTNMYLEMTAGTVTVTLSTLDGRIYSGEKAELISNHLEAKTPAATIIVDGTRKDGIYETITDIMGEQATKQFEFPTETLDDYLSVQIKARSEQLHPGDVFKQSIFVPEPAIMDKMTHHIEFIEEQDLYIAGIETKVYALRDSVPELQIGGNSYIEKSGTLIMQEYPSMGMVMKLEPEDLAKTVESNFDFLRDNIIKPEGIGLESNKVKSALYIISGYNKTLLPESSWQKITQDHGDSISLEVIAKTNDVNTTMLPISDPALSEYLRAEPLIQSDNAEIKKLAAEIVGQEKNALLAAELINEWVFRNIKAEYTPDYSNAYQTLKTKSGDCGEHAALAAALLRAAGIPSRVAGGIAYTPQFAGFGYHAWIEAYVGEWIEMDPTWGETFADATHIMLTHGSMSDQMTAILRAFRQLKISIISYQY